LINNLGDWGFPQDVGNGDHTVVEKHGVVLFPLLAKTWYTGRLLEIHGF